MNIVRCQQCVYWDYDAIEDAPVGVCRYNPPVPRTVLAGTADETGVEAVWPVTEDGDWCRMGLKRS